MFRTVLLLPLVFFLAVGSLSGQTSPERFPDRGFRYYGLTEGLSHETVLTMQKDSRGFLWIGTMDGLNRFDGHQFQVYRHDSGNPESLSHNYIHGIFEDQQGHLWIATRNGGLSRYNYHTDSFSNYTEASGSGLRGSNVHLISSDHFGRIWSSIYRNGVYVWNPQTNSFHEVAIKVRGANTFAETASSLIAVPGGGMLLHTDLGILAFSKQAVESLDPFDDDTVFEGELLVDFGAYSIENARSVPDENGNVHVVHQNELITTISTETLRRNGVLHDDSRWEDLLENRFPSPYQYLLGNESGGYTIFNTRTLQFTHRPDNNQPGLGTRVYRDGTNTWILTWGGGFKQLIPPSRFNLIANRPGQPEILKRNFILSLQDADNGRFWIGTADGITEWNELSDRFRNLRFQTQSGEILSDITPYFLKLESHGMWIGTRFHGLLHISTAEVNRDSELRRATRFVRDENLDGPLPQDFIRAAHTDAYGRLWIGTENEGICVLNDVFETLRIRRVENCHYLRQSESATGGLSDSDIRFILFENDSTAWVSTFAGGVNRVVYPNGAPQGNIRVRQFDYNPGDPSGLSYQTAAGLAISADGNLWVSTYGGGLNRIDLSDYSISVLSTSDGLSSNNLYGHLIDEFDHIWISTNNGLNRYDPATGNIRVYTVSDGLQNNEFNTGAFHKSRDGRLLFGGIGGFNIFRASELQVNPLPPPVHITEIRVFDEPLKTEISVFDLNEITLPWSQNFLSFEFAALDYTDPRRNQYAYKMEGIDADWVFAGNRNFAGYPNLPPGTYRFIVRGSNNDGIWNEDGRAIRILITPPFWQTGWFRFLYIATGFLLLVYVVRHVSTRRLKEKVRQMEIEQRVQSERERISRDLHDHVGAQLVNIMSGISLVSRYGTAVEDPKARELLTSLKEEAQNTIKQLRDTIWTLNRNQISNRDFKEHLEKYTAQVTELTHLSIDVQFPIEPFNLSPGQALNSFRIIQEAIQNTVKHSGAGEVQVIFEKNAGRLTISVIDNGLFKAENDEFGTGSGLGNMKKRAQELSGEVQVQAGEGGTTVQFSFPIKV